MKQTKRKISAFVMLVSFFVVALTACDLVSGNSKYENITIFLGKSRTARAISDDEKSTVTFNVYFNNNLVGKNVIGTFTGKAEVGTKLRIRVDALINGKRIARGENTITVAQGENTVPIKMEENREITAELKGVPTVGSIIMKDGTLCDTNSVVGRETEAIAVVYKVDTNVKKAWAVGKELSSSGMMWAAAPAIGTTTNITALQEENGYTDGSTGLTILQREATDAITDLENKYPAWDYACNYGTKQKLTKFLTGWYLPSKQELQEVNDNKDAIEVALAHTGVSKTSFGASFYWSSSQAPQSNNKITDFVFIKSFSTSHSGWAYGSSDTTDDVCAVRQFTY